MSTSSWTGLHAGNNEGRAEIGRSRLGVRERFALFALLRLAATASLALDPVIRVARNLRF